MPLTKDKKTLNKLIQQSESDDSEHELSHYVNDRVKLMKEVIKIIKPKRIKAMAPTYLKDLDMEEINSMLLEELLGISNKRLKYIFNGQNLDEDSSSSTNEEESIDIISLDDISDEDFINLDNEDEVCNPSMKKVKKEHKHSRVKKEKRKCTIKKEKGGTVGKIKQADGSTHTVEAERIDSNENLMSVLELLELQARARAIKSQLLLENAKTQENISNIKDSIIDQNEGSDDDVIIATTKAEEIIITSSGSEPECELDNEYTITEGNEKKKKSIREFSHSYCETDRQESTLPKAIEILEDLSGGNDNKYVQNIESSEINEKNNVSLNYLPDLKESSKLQVMSQSIQNNSTCIDEVIPKQCVDAELNDISKGMKKVTDETEKTSYEKDRGDNLKEKHLDNDEIVVINLSDDEMNELK